MRERLFALFVLCAATPAGAARHAGRPNIILIMGDDIGWFNVAGGKGTVLEGGFRVPMILRWPGKVPAGRVENGIVSGLDWFPTFVAAAGNPNIKEELLRGKELGGRTYKVHLDGYNQLPLVSGAGPSARREIFYFAESTLGAVRIGDYKYRFIEFWRFVLAQQLVAEYARSFVEFPPMQRGASFNMEAVKAQIEKAIHSQSGQ